jgi:hypothetical protein
MNCIPLRRVERHSLEPLLLYQEINESFHIRCRPFELRDNELLVTGLHIDNGLRTSIWSEGVTSGCSKTFFASSHGHSAGT